MGMLAVKDNLHAIAKRLDRKVEHLVVLALDWPCEHSRSDHHLVWQMVVTIGQSPHTPIVVSELDRSAYVSSFLITSPLTSVRRKSRPWNLKVNWVWSRPSR